MTDDNECFDINEMSEEEKDEALLSIHHAYHEALDDMSALERNVGTLVAAMNVVADGCAKGNALGRRAQTLNMAEAKLRSIATLAIMAMPGAAMAGIRDKMEYDFGAIASELESDPTFQDMISDLGDDSK